MICEGCEVEVVFGDHAKHRLNAAFGLLFLLLFHHRFLLLRCHLLRAFTLFTQ